MTLFNNVEDVGDNLGSDSLSSNQTGTSRSTPAETEYLTM